MTGMEGMGFVYLAASHGYQFYFPLPLFLTERGHQWNLNIAGKGIRIGRFTLFPCAKLYKVKPR